MSQTKQFRVPSIISTGPGAAKEAGIHAKQLGKKALLVTDANLVKIGLLEEVKASLDAAGVPYSIYDKVMREPVVEYVEEGLRAFRDAGADIVVSVGGGSPIDAGKAIASLSRNPGEISDYVGTSKIAKPSAPLIAIPTTATMKSQLAIPGRAEAHATLVHWPVRARPTGQLAAREALLPVRPAR